MTAPHDDAAAERGWPYPDAGELVTAIREWLSEPGDKPVFHRRVAANSLGIVERELAGRAAVDRDELHRARTLGVESMVDLAARLRAGDLDDRLDEVSGVLDASVRARLAIDRPGYDA